MLIHRGGINTHGNRRRVNLFPAHRNLIESLLVFRNHTLHVSDGFDLGDRRFHRLETIGIGYNPAGSSTCHTHEKENGDEKSPLSTALFLADFLIHDRGEFRID